MSLGSNLIKKGALVQVLSCEYCEIFKNIFFYGTPPVVPSKSVIQMRVIACQKIPCYM